MIRRMFRIGVLAAVLLSSASCDVFGPAAVRVKTDSAEYVAEALGTGPQYGFTAVVTIHNGRPSAVVLEACDREVPTYALRGAHGGAAVVAYDPVWSCAAVPGIRVEPGETRTDVIHVRGPNAIMHGTGEFPGVLEGEFELVYRVCGGGCRRFASNSFRVTLAR